MIRFLTVAIPCTVALLLASCRERSQEESSSSGLDGSSTSSSSARVEPVEFPQKQQWSHLPDAMREALTSSEQVMSGRIDLVRSLVSPFEESELEALYQLLHGPCPEELSQSQWRLLANELMEVLRHNGEANERYGNELLAIAEQSDSDPVLRDYALQHWFLAMETELSELPKEEQEPVLLARLAKLTPLLEQPDSLQFTLWGTALQSATAVAESQSSWQPGIAAMVEKQAQSALAEGSAASVPNQVAAIQSVARLSLEDFLPRVRSLAADESAHSSLRLSSIAALGYFGDQSAQSFLETLTQSDQGLKYAAISALKKISQSQ